MNEQSASRGELDVDQGHLTDSWGVCGRTEQDQTIRICLDMLEPGLAIRNFEEQFLHVLYFPLRSREFQSVKATTRHRPRCLLRMVMRPSFGSRPKMTTAVAGLAMRILAGGRPNRVTASR